MRMYDIIEKKRNGLELDENEIGFFVKGVTDGSIPDYQTSALLMAICLNGMSDRETALLTDCMTHSGDVVSFDGIDGFCVDKHSTGGVGDKVTLVVAPIVAALGGKVAKMSGRGLGHTGGTIDKLESINGYKTDLTHDEFIKAVNDVGLCVIGMSDNLAPADKKLYALRDVTATVESIPLIASSIMSKKLAAGTQGIVLDVTVGSGAFMKTTELAEELANQMVEIGKSANRKVTAVLTNMDVPLGESVGNALEIKEAVSLLKGEAKDDLKKVCFEIAARMMMLVSSKGYDECLADVEHTVDDGSAYKKFKEWIARQGGDIRQIEDLSLLPDAKFSLDVKAENDGFISHMDAEKIGVASLLLGAGREKKEDRIDFSAGILLKKKTGDAVSKGDTLAVLFSNDKNKLKSAEEKYLSALTFSSDKVKEPKLIYKIIE